MADQEVTIRISAKNLTSEEFQKARQELAGLSEAAGHAADGISARMIAAGHVMADAFEKGLEGVLKLVDAFPELIEHTIQLGSELYTTSLKTGASVENLSKLRYVAAQTGVDFGSMTNAMFKFQANLGGVGEEGKKTSDALGRLGLSLQTLKNERPDDAFIQVITALEKVPNRADQARIGMELFGKGFKEMSQLTQEGFTDLMQEAEDLGLVMDTRTAAAAKRAEDAMQALHAQFEAVSVKIGAAFLPALATVTKLLSQEFNEAINAASGSGLDMDSVIKTIVHTLLDWASVAVDVAQFIDHAFEGTKAIFFDLSGKVVDLINVFLKFEEVIVDYASRIPGVGKAFSGMRDQIKDTVTWLDGFSQGLHQESDATLDAAAKHDLVFKAIKTGIQDMSGNFNAELDKTNQEIDHLASVSKKAYGGVGQDIGDVTGQMKKFNEAWTNLNSLGTTYDDTIAQINPKIRDSVLYYAQLGASVDDLVNAFPGLTKAQAEAAQKSVKAAEEFAKAWEKTSLETQKIWGDVFEAQATYGKSGLDLQLAQLTQKQQNERNAAAESIKDETLLQDRLYAIDAKYDELRANARQAETQKNLDATNKLWVDYYDLVDRETLTSTDYQLRKIQEWVAAEVQALTEDTPDAWMQHYNAIVAVANQKARMVAQANDPVWRAWQDLNRDMRSEWASTWEKVLSGEASVTDALLQPFKELGTGIKKILAGILADMEQQFLAPFLNAVKGSIGNVLGAGGPGGSSGGGISGMLSGFQNMSSTARFGGGGMMAFGGLMGGISNMQQGGGFGTLQGLQTGAGIGTMIMPGIGTAIGAGVGALAGWISGIGKPSKEELAGRQVVADEEKMLQSLLTTQQKVEAGGESWKQTVISVRDSYLATGRSAKEAEDAVKKLWASSKNGAEASKKAAEEINAVLNEQKRDEADLNDAIKRYGFSIEELGPAMKKQQLTEQAVQLENDFRLLVNSGIDVNTVIQRMGGSINDFIQLAQRTGTEVPAEMKPILQKMVELGQLTDANGNKIENLDDAGLSFSETMTQGFDRVVKKLDEVFNKFLGIGNAVNSIPRNVDIEVNGRYNAPDIPDYGGDQGTVPGFATEAYVRRPTLAMIGDVSGGEFVLKPSTVKRLMDASAKAGAAGAQGGGGGHTVHVEINTVTASPEQIRKLVHQEIGPKLLDWLGGNKGGSQTDMKQILGVA